MKKRKGCRLFRSLVARCRRIRGFSKRNNVPADNQLNPHGEIIPDVLPVSSSSDANQSAGGTSRNRRGLTEDCEVDIEVIQSTVTLDAHIGKSKLNVRQKNKRAPSASHLKMRLQAADEDQLWNLSNDDPVVVIHKTQASGVHNVNIEAVDTHLAIFTGSKLGDESQEGTIRKLMMKSVGLDDTRCESTSQSTAEVSCFSSPIESASSSDVISVALCVGEEKTAISEVTMSSIDDKLNTINQLDHLQSDVSEDKVDSNENLMQGIRKLDEGSQSLEREQEQVQSSLSLPEAKVNDVCKITGVSEPTVVIRIAADAEDEKTGYKSGKTRATVDDAKQPGNVSCQISAGGVSEVNLEDRDLIKRRNLSNIVSSETRHSTDVSSFIPKRSSAFLSRNQSDCGTEVKGNKTAVISQTFGGAYNIHEVDKSQNSAARVKEETPSLKTADEKVDISWKLSRTVSAMETRAMPLKNPAVQLLKEQYSKVSAVKQVEACDSTQLTSKPSAPMKFELGKSLSDDSRLPTVVASEGSHHAELAVACATEIDVKPGMDQTHDSNKQSTSGKADELVELTAAQSQNPFSSSSVVDHDFKSGDKIDVASVTINDVKSSVKPAVTLKVPSLRSGSKVKPVQANINLSENSPAWAARCKVDWKVEDVEKIQSCIDISRGFLTEEEDVGALQRDGTRSSVREMVRKLQGQRVG